MILWAGQTTEAACLQYHYLILQATRDKGHGTRDGPHEATASYTGRS